MNRNEKYIARIIFKNRVHESDGQGYEDLFSKVMYKNNKNFSKVKAYGNIGDMKNDGFDKTTGTYYQVFAPENVRKQKTINDAVEKLETDFKGLIKHWEDVCSINNFFYVVNDKYKGIPAPVHQKIIEMNRLYQEKNCDIFPVNKLEDIFINLEDDDIIDIINYSPDINVEQLDYSILTEAVDYILSCEADNSLEQKLDVPDFDEKIKFNCLSPLINTWLTTASYNMGDLDRFFRRNSNYARKELRNKFNEFYVEAKNKIDNKEESYNDRRFIYILEKASYNTKKQVRDAVLILMSCFFESCDIFENPRGEEV